MYKQSSSIPGERGDILSKKFSKLVRKLTAQVAALNPGSEEGVFETTVARVLDRNGFKESPDRDELFSDISKLSQIWMQAKMDKEERTRIFNELHFSLNFSLPSPQS